MALKSRPKRSDRMKKVKTKPYILVAEDDPSYARLYELKLKKEGFDVIVAPNGAEAMKAAQKQIPSLILLDLIMPVQDGFETLEQLKADKTLSRVKTVVSSNLGQEEDRKKARELGADDYFVKAETSVQDIVTLVRKYLG